MRVKNALGARRMSFPQQSVLLACCHPLVFFFSFNFLFCTGVLPVNNVVMVSGEQRMNSTMHTHVSILFPILLASVLTSVVTSPHSTTAVAS